jgi:hypothetical protein
LKFTYFILETMIIKVFYNNTLITVEINSESTTFETLLLALSSFLNNSNGSNNNIFQERKLLLPSKGFLLNTETQVVSEFLKDNEMVYVMDTKLNSDNIEIKQESGLFENLLKTFENIETFVFPKSSNDMETRTSENFDNYSYWKKKIDKATTHLNNADESPFSSESTDFANKNLSGLGLFRSLIKTFLAFSKDLQPNTEQETSSDESDEEVDESFDPFSDIDEIPKGSLLQLKEMGFSVESAKKALILNRCSPTLACEWLLKQSEESLSEPLTSTQLKYIKRQRERDKSFHIDENARCLLVAMGFSPADVRTSLLLFNNDQQAACDWLLGYKPHPLLEDDLEEVDALDVDHPLVRSMFEDQIIKRALSNPNVYSALKKVQGKQKMLDFLVNQDAAPVLLQLIKLLSDSGS